MPKRPGRKSAAQTPAPKSERIVGSKKNPKGSAKSSKSAKNIQLSRKIIETLKNKAKEFNEKHPKKKVSVSTLKAVFRRGTGAYSSSHRPTITGGAPNSRSAWAFARVNTFLAKKAGQKVKAAYVQDDDLLKYMDGGLAGYRAITAKGTYETANDLDLIVKTAIEKDIDAKKMTYKEFRDKINAEIPEKSFSFIELRLAYAELKKTNYEDGGLIAPNGKPSNLTPKQYKLVRTPEFKAWFGDWENDPANASKVVDENGEPLVVYHGTSGDLFYEFMPYAVEYVNGEALKEFRGNRSEEEFDEYIKQYGLRKIEPRFYFSIRHIWGDKNLQCFLNIKNMYVTDDYTPKISKEYNGFRVPNEDGNDYYCVFQSNQIKLADGSNTTFDGENPDIRYAKGGEVDKGQVNYGEPNVTIDKIPLIHETIKEYAKSILKEGFKKSSNKNITFGVYTIPLVWKKSPFDNSNRSGTEIKVKLKKGSKIFWTNTNRPMDFYYGVGNKYFNSLFKKLGGKNDDSNRLKFLRNFEKWLDDNGYCGVQQGGEIVITNLSCIDRVEKYSRDKLAKGGEVVTCKKCGWSWKESETTPEEKYICHKCYFNNETLAKGGQTNKKTMKSRGNCYQAAADFCIGKFYAPEMIEFKGEPYLVHAEVSGQGKLDGIRYGHAWIEDDENVYDYSNNREIILPKAVYYAIGQVRTDDPKKYKRYTFQEAREKMLETQTYGSWDIETDYRDGGKVYNDKELLEKWKAGDKIGFSAIAHLKSKGLIPRSDGEKRKSMEDGGEMAQGGSIKNFSDFKEQLLGIAKQQPSPKDFTEALKQSPLKPYLPTYFTNSRRDILGVSDQDWVKYMSNPSQYAKELSEVSWEKVYDKVKMAKGGQTSEFAIKGMTEPFLLRLLEFAKEDAKTDMDLHKLVENVANAYHTKDVLTMDDYDSVVSGILESETPQEFKSDLFGIKKQLLNTQYETALKLADHIKLDGLTKEQYAKAHTINWAKDFTNEMMPEQEEVLVDIKTGQPVGKRTDFLIRREFKNGGLISMDQLNPYNRDKVLREGYEIGKTAFLAKKEGGNFPSIGEIVGYKQKGRFKDLFVVTNKGLEVGSNKLLELSMLEKFGFKLENGGQAPTSLDSVDTEQLDYFEKFMFDDLSQRMGKAEALKVIINNVEGDYSQLSDELRKYAQFEDFENQYASQLQTEVETLETIKETPFTLWVENHATDVSAGWEYNTLEQAVESANNIGIFENNNNYEIRDTDTGRLLLNREQILDVLAGKAVAAQIAQFAYGGDVDEMVESESLIADEKEEAKSILYSRKMSKLQKIMYISDKLDIARSQFQNAQDGYEQNVWDEVFEIWKDAFARVERNHCERVRPEYKEGGVTSDCGCGKYYANGGLAYGNSHAKGGMPMVVKSTGQEIEIEGGEGVVNKKTMQMTKKVTLNGEKMTPCEAVSELNEMGGGVEFKCEDVKEILDQDGNF